jgi:type IV secretory pathway VirB3-like protein
MARTVDTLFVAMTRPSVKWGVPVEGLVVNFLLTMIVTVLIVHAPPGMALFGPIHFGLREVCRIDPHFFWRWRQWKQTKAGSAAAIAQLLLGAQLQPSVDTVRKSADMPSAI